MLITLILNNKYLDSYLKKLQINNKGKYKYIILGERDVKAINLLEIKYFQELIHSKYDELYRRRFIQEYIDLVAFIGKENNTKRWWATDMASKNRFMSKLSILLHQFLLAVETINNEDFDHLIILNPSWVILNSLKIFLKKKNLKFECFENHTKKWMELGHIWSKIILAAIYSAFRICIQKHYIQKRLRHIIREKLSCSKSYYVIKTFIYNHSFSEEGIYKDVFFGNLPNYLKEKTQILTYAAILGNYKLCIQKINACRSQTILPIEAFLSYPDILNALIQSLFCKIRIRKEALFFGYEVSDIINAELFRTHNGIPFYQFLHYWSTKRLLQSASIETFLLTYENNPWEKMCMMAVRECSPNTTIIGYQHTVVPQASANMFISQYEKDIMPMPDRILTVGERPKEIMEKYGAYETIRIEPACGLRFEYLFQTGANPRQKSGHILVVLEGIFDVYKMVNYVLRELRGTPFQATIRTHPVLPLDGIRHKLEQRPEETPNFRISSGRSLKEDIQDADMIIYWGSTVALEALSLGKPVIHFAMDSVLSFDPLFECKHLKWVVSANDSLVSAIEEIYAMNDERFEEERKKAKAYLSRYFFPVTDESLAKFL